MPGDSSLHQQRDENIFLLVWAIEMGLIIGRDAEEGIEFKGAAELSYSLAILGIRPPKFAKEISFITCLAPTTENLKSATIVRHVLSTFIEVYLIFPKLKCGCTSSIQTYHNSNLKF